MKMPLVSVVLPARNEAHTIIQSLESLLAVDYPHFEVLVVDDCSEDSTAALVRTFIATYTGAKTVQLLQAPSDPPAGWVGKTFAADFAIKKSVGEIVLVCDADIRHKKHSLTKAVARMQKDRLEMLSQLPHFDMRSIGEYPLLFQTFLLYYTSYLARLLGSRQSFIMGTYLMFTRDFYERSGGWSRHREYPESLPLLNYCIDHEERFLFLPDRGEISTHMHQGARGTFLGLVRNSNFAILQPLPLVLFISAVVLFSSAFGLMLRGNGIALYIVSAISGLFALHLIRSSYPFRVICIATILSPLMPYYLLIVAFFSLYRKIFKIPTHWRGRYMQQQ